MKRSALTFSVGFLLFVSLCVAGLLAGYRTGFSRGYSAGEAKRQSEKPYPKVYEVGALLPRQVGDQLDYASLMAATQTTVFPDEWEALGGPCTMAPLPSLESLAVNATSGVHGRLQAFLGDLASVKLAVAKSKEEQQAMQRARDQWVDGILRPISERLGEELTPIESGFAATGVWDVASTDADGGTSEYQYTFVDADTVQIALSEDGAEPEESWYFVSPGNMVIAGKAYLAATTPEGSLVLIRSDAPQTFMVARTSDDESSDGELTDGALSGDASM